MIGGASSEVNIGYIKLRLKSVFANYFFISSLDQTNKWSLLQSNFFGGLAEPSFAIYITTNSLFINLQNRKL